ncbi:MAG TPA: hypothetical protein VHA54_11435 [Solirubrobacterales bacterium]|nr:hypothetical protein [Solirubrobacterales bacterium]
MTLDRSQDLDLSGRRQHPIYRRIGLGVLALIALAALLNVFGQESTTTVASGPAAVLSVESPPRLRGGLLFQTRIEVRARRAIAHPKLVLSPGWLEGMTQNTVVPTPESESSSADGLAMNFSPLPAGETLVVWIAWQVNPTTVGSHDEDVELRDGSTPVATVNRTVTVFP